MKRELKSNIKDPNSSSQARQGQQGPKHTFLSSSKAIRVMMARGQQKRPWCAGNQNPCASVSLGCPELCSGLLPALPSRRSQWSPPQGSYVREAPRCSRTLKGLVATSLTYYLSVPSRLGSGPLWRWQELNGDLHPLPTASRRWDVSQIGKLSEESILLEDNRLNNLRPSRLIKNSF